MERTIYEIRKVSPGADYFTRATQPVVERWVIGAQAAWDYAATLTNETGIRHLAWAAGFLDKDGKACTTDKRGRVVALRA
jgi:hypothetical protein